MVEDIWLVIWQERECLWRGQLFISLYSLVVLICQISSHPLLPLEAGRNVQAFPSVPHSSPLQYRLESNTVKLFAKGTGRGYL